MTITVDTDLMGAMAASISGAQLEMESCAAAMGRVVEHGDWCCQERDMINEAIRALREQVRRLGEDMEQFAGAIRGAANDFGEMERSIPAIFQELDVMVGRLAAVSPGSGQAAGELAAGIAQRAARESAPAGRLESYSAGSLNEDIRVCRFDDFLPRD